LGATAVLSRKVAPTTCPLSDTAIRNAKCETKPIRLFDERGMYLELSPSGGKWWRLKYRFAEKEKRLSLGVYPDTGLKAAREHRDAARSILANGIDPSEHRKAHRAALVASTADIFEAVTREWISKYSGSWAPSHAERVLRLFERDLFPWVGNRPISNVTAPDLLTAVRRIEARGARDTAHRALGNCGQVFRYAIATGRAESDPCPSLRGALAPARDKHFAAATDPAELAQVLRVIDGYEGTLAVRCALRLMPLVFVRPGELRHAEWSDIDLDAKEWRYTVTKTNSPHIVPLSRQAVGILRELYPLTESGRYIFPSARSNPRPMSDNAILAAMRRAVILKEEMTGHGFRATARTLLDEVLGVRPDFIEHQLAHAVRDPNGRAYNRTAHLAERCKMMQQWADYLDSLKSGAEVIPIYTRASR
jgi:integrase